MAKINNIKKFRQRFVKDYNLPINIFDDNLFEYYIQLYDFFPYPRYKETIEKIENEYNELMKRIGELKAILADEKLLLGVIREEIKLIRDKYGDDRKTSMGVDDDEITVEDLINNMNEVANCLVNIKRFVGHSTPEKVVEMIEYNIKLVWLNERIEPESIVAVMNNQEYKLYDINYLRGSYTTLLGTTDEAEKIFEGIF